MALTKCTVATDVVGSLGTSPAERAITTQQFKDKFDEMPEGIKDYLNNILTTEVDAYSQQSTLRQAIINGNFSINQRVVSGTVVLAAGQYGHDRWKAGAAGCTYTFATVENVTTITITAGSLQQVIEGLNLSTGTYTLSWTGTAQGKIGAGSYGVSGITGSATGGTNLTVEFGIGTLSKVQFNFGAIALPFTPKSFDDELRSCLRYYEKSYDYATAPGTSTLVSMLAYSTPSTIPNYAPYGSVTFSVPKRTIPTVVIYPYATPSNTGRVSDFNSTDLAANSGDVLNKSVKSFIVRNNTGGSISVSTNSIMLHYTADAEL